MPPVIPIQLPARRPMDSINMYLIREDPITLIDAGWDSSETEAALARTLQAEGLTWQDIRRVLVTHTHPDHVGFAYRLETLCPADIYMHVLEWDKLQQGMADNLHLFRWAGIPPSYHKASHPHHSDLPSSPAWFKALQDGDILAFAQGSLTVVHTPGHCSGQVCLFEEDEGVMFTSDHLIPNFSPALLVEPGPNGLSDRTPNLQQYQNSLKKAAAFPIQSAYPGHGNRFSDVHAMIDRKLNHSIPEKLKRIQGFLSERPQTVYDLVTLMIPELPPALAFFACGDTLAYLDQLVAEQRAGSILEQERILFYRTD